MSDFTPTAYRNLLVALRERGYDSCGYTDAEPGHRHLIIRHDIDMSLAAALPIAEIERELGMSAHYFVLLRTEMYNPFSAASRSMLQRLRQLGHEIGLHLDAALYANDPDTINRAAAAECNVLEAATGSPVRTISFHRPAKALLGYPGPLAGRPHAYQPRYFSKMGYCSDSRGAWHHGHPLDHPAVRDGRALQLLTHPVWWSGDPDVISRLDRFLHERTELLSRELARNCDPYSAALLRKIGQNRSYEAKP